MLGLVKNSTQPTATATSPHSQSLRLNDSRLQFGSLNHASGGKGFFALGAVVHLELDRMRRVLEADHLRDLQLDIAVDEIVVEHATGL
jgi:hypothetical protein